MKRLMISMICLMAMTVPSAAKDGGEAVVRAQGNVCKVIFYSPEIVRVVKYPEGAAEPERKSLVVTMTPQENVKLSMSDNGGTTVVKSTALTVNIDRQTGAVSFSKNGKNLLSEKSVAFEERTDGPDKGAYRITQVYRLDDDEPIYGLGTLQDSSVTVRACGAVTWLHHGICCAGRFRRD